MFKSTYYVNNYWVDNPLFITSHDIDEVMFLLSQKYGVEFFEQGWTKDTSHFMNKGNVPYTMDVECWTIKHNNDLTTKITITKMTPHIIKHT